MQTLCPESGHRTAPNWPKIRKMTMTSQFPDMTSKSFFLRCFVFLVKFSYLSKFHVNIITGSEIITIFFYKQLTRNPEIGNTPVWVLPISGDWGKLWIPYLAQMSPIKYYWMLQNSRVTALTVFELLRENQLGGDKITPPPRPRLGLNE